MRRRSLGFLSAAVLFTNGIAFGQDAISAPGGGPSSAAYDWLSPAPLAWAVPGFNWADLPAVLYIHEYGGYNSNVFNVFPETILPSGLRRGDQFLRTDVGASSKINVEGQQFFVDMDYTTTDYLHDVSVDLHNHSVDGGVNWRLNSLCNGTLTATSKVVQAPQEELVAEGIDILTSNVITESSQCHLYQDINAIGNFGASTTRHSQLASQPLDNNTAFAQGGLQYAWNNLDNIELLFKYSDTKYVNNVGSTSTTGLPQSVQVADMRAMYNNTISQKLNFSLMGGFAQALSDVTSVTATVNTSPQPIYSGTINYQLSDKLAIMANASHLVTAPTSIIANIQTTTVESAAVSYFWSSKITFSASLANTEITGSFGTSNRTQSSNLFGANNLTSATLKAIYIITPFTSLALSIQNSSRSLNGQNLNTNLVMMGLDYKPY